ncbi:sensor histidine kinase [Woodsholea maritima]|uniref:sensor histidine kinase n=1 Tax=Woodsholea maritima TaxID=240237 RepID=UPI0014614E7E|nr:HAMP domain-containing sensor histidine kinase [Woodsholea maritima]
MRRAFLTIDRIGGPVVHAVWLCGVIASAIALHQSQALSMNAICGWAALALPGLVGLGLSSRLNADSRRFLLTLSWVIPVFAATAAFGGALSPAAFIFLAGPAAMAAAGRRSAVIPSAITNVTAFAILGVLSLTQISAQPFSDHLLSPVPALSLAGFFAIALIFAGLRASLRLDRTRDAAKALQPVAHAFECAPAALVACDGEGKVIAASRAVRALVPGAPRNLEGLPIEGFAFGEEDSSKILQGLSQVHMSGRFTFSVRSGDGQRSPIFARSAASPEGTVLHLHGGAPDQSYIDSLKAERDEAVAANHAKSDFLASVSHELRTPLNAIIGFSDVMKSRLFGPLPARYAEYAELIHESGCHLLELIGDVLDMSKIEADRYELTLENFDARDVVETCAKLVRLRAEDKGLMLSVDTGDQDLIVNADRKAVRQILLNLLSNAVKFTPDGGAVAVMARAQGDEFVLAVGDSGVGISADEIDKLGQPYQQARSAIENGERGTGLGLSLVRALAEMHGGLMDIQSERYQGTTVTVRLPVLSGPQPNRRPDEDEDTLAVHSQIRRAQEAGQHIAQASAQASNQNKTEFDGASVVSLNQRIAS